MFVYLTCSVHVKSAHKHLMLGETWLHIYKLDVLLKYRSSVSKCLNCKMLVDFSYFFASLFLHNLTLIFCPKLPTILCGGSTHFWENIRTILRQQHPNISPLYRQIAQYHHISLYTIYSVSK